MHYGKHRYCFNNEFVGEKVLRSSERLSTFQQLTGCGGVSQVGLKTGEGCEDGRKPGRG